LSQPLVDLAGPPLIDFSMLCDDIARQGYGVFRIGQIDMLAALRAEALQLRDEEALTLAGIGREDGGEIERAIRRDRTRWFDGTSDAQARYLAFAEQLREAVNRELFLGVFSFECHYALYDEPGAFYRKHVDSFRGKRNRLLSTVLYLNPDWEPTHGGALRIYDEQDRMIEDIAPEFGSLAVFLSEEIPHEVLETAKSRLSIAGWFRCNDRSVSPALQGQGLPLASTAMDSPTSSWTADLQRSP